MYEEDIFISIIIPVYNTKNYLKKCLDSLINQSLKNIEIIVVNDGSTDNSLEILNEYSNLDERITIIDKKNEGQSIARNVGLKKAKGKYIAFVDSDDYVDLDTYEKVYDFARKHNDIVIFDAIRFNSEKEWKAKIHRKSIPNESIASTNIFESQNLVYDTCVWNKIIRKSFWDKNKFSFLDGRLYEDILLSGEMYCAAESVGVCSEVQYHWRLREGEDKSTTQNTTKIKNLKDRIFTINELTRLYKSNTSYKKLLVPHYKKCVEYDLPIFINRVNHADEHFQNELINEIKPLIESIPSKFFDNFGFFDKAKYQAIFDNDLETLKVIVRYYLRYSKKNPFLKIPIILLNALKEGNFCLLFSSIMKNINR